MRLRSNNAAMGGSSLAPVLAAAAAIATMIAAPARADIKRLDSIPISFQGSWAPSTDGCASDSGTVITVSAKTYAVGQDSCTLITLSETAGARGAIYAARLRCLNAKTQKTTAANLILRAVATDQISLGADFDSLKTYQRCPAAAAR